MRYYLDKEITVLPSMCDSRARLAVHSVFEQFMDIATEHAAVLGVGLTDMAPRHLFWLTAKTAVRFIRRPKMMEKVTVRTWPGTLERARVWRYYQLRSGDEVLAEGKTEWAVLETDTGKLHDIRDVFPPDFEGNTETACDGAAARITPDFTGCTEAGSYTVRSVDIDMGGHMNNCAYLRAMLGLFSLAEQKDMPLDCIEVLFRSPCFEGNTLRFLRRNTGDGMELGAFLPDGKCAFLAALKRV